jgi:hypothetical protein
MIYTEFVVLFENWLEKRGYACPEFFYSEIYTQFNTGKKYVEFRYINEPYSLNDIGNTNVEWKYDSHIFHKFNVFNPTEELKLVRKEKINNVLYH